MPYDTTIAKVMFHFALSNATTELDIAEFAVNAQLDITLAPEDYDSALLAIAAGAYQSWVDNWEPTDFPNAVSLAYTQATTYDAAGKTAHEQRHVPSSVWEGTGTTPSMPWNDSYCISLYTYTPGTFIANARRRRGRFYLPPLKSTYPADPWTASLDSGQVSDKIESARDMLLAWQDDNFDGHGAGITPGVYSRVDEHFYGLTDVSADQVIDSQRRRTHQIPKTRQSVQFVAP